MRNDELLYKKLSGILCRKIFDGSYDDGSLLPTERDLAGKYGMSRVTVRHTLARMADEGYVTRRQGHGTRVKLLRSGFSGPMNIIVVIAPAENPFFSSFISNFEACAEPHDALVVFKAAGKQSMEDILFRFYERNIRNAVIWPYDEIIDVDAFARLRGLGMNLVFFDRVVNSGAADYVSVDNAQAVSAMHAWLRAKCRGDIAYIGWQNDVISSNRERESAFDEIAGSDLVYRLPWKRERDVDSDVADLVKGIPPGVDGVICGNGVIGIAAKKCVNILRKNIRVVCIDDLPGAEALSLTTYIQPMDKLANAVYRRLVLQSEKARAWKPKTIYIKGEIVIRS